MPGKSKPNTTKRAKKTKDLTLQIRLTSEQRACLQAAADANELDVSTWIRQVALIAARTKAGEVIAVTPAAARPSEVFIAAENEAIAVEDRQRKRRP